MKLSIIIPVYNMEEYIEDTLDSLLNISFSYEYEIVVVNDGSTDNSTEVIEKYLEGKANYQLINIENKGVSNARNIGMRHANGEYIAFVDGDDTVEPLFFEKAIKEIEEGEYDFVQSNFRIVKEKGTKVIQNTQNDLVIDSKDKMLELLFGKNKLIHNSAWGKVFRAGSIRGISFDTSIRVAEDLKFVFDIIQNATRIKLLSYIGYNYYYRSSSVMRVPDLNKRYDAIKVLLFCKNNVVSTAARYNIENRIIKSLVDLYNQAYLNGSDASKYYNDLLMCDCSRFKGFYTIIEYVKLVLLLKHRCLYHHVLDIKKHAMSKGKI